MPKKAKKDKGAKRRRRSGQLVRVIGADLVDEIMTESAQGRRRRSRFWALLAPPPLPLAPGERFRLATRMHWYVPLQDIIKGLAGVPVTIVIAMILSWLSGTWWVGAAAALVAATHQGRYAYHILKWRARMLVVTSTRLVYLKGVVRRSLADKTLTKVKDIKVDQSIPGRLFGFGHLIIVTGAESIDGAAKESKEVIKFVPRPYEVYAAVRGA